MFFKKGVLQVALFRNSHAEVLFKKVLCKYGQLDWNYSFVWVFSHQFAAPIVFKIINYKNKLCQFQCFSWCFYFHLLIKFLKIRKYIGSNVYCWITVQYFMTFFLVFLHLYSCKISYFHIMPFCNIINGIMFRDGYPFFTYS